MFKISDVISLPVISIYESDYKGIVYNLLLDKTQKKCKYFCILDEEENINHRLPIDNIFTIGDECILIKNNTLLELDCNNHYELNLINPLNLPVYNLNGKSFGSCIDIIIDNKQCVSSMLLSNGATIQADKILNIGNSAILIGEKNINIAKFKPNQRIKQKLTNHNKVVMLTKFDKPSTENTNNPSNTNKIITDFRFLIGRILNKDIVAINGEIIAKHGTAITKDIINKASLYGKLVEITRHSSNKKISN